MRLKKLLSKLLRYVHTQTFTKYNTRLPAHTHHSFIHSIHARSTKHTQPIPSYLLQLENVATTLTKKLSTAKEELDESAQAQQKQSKMHHKEITAQQEKYRNACQDYNAQTEAFRREVLEANLTADKLRAKLARLEMAHSPDDVDIIAARTMQSMETPEKVENYNKVLAKVGGIAVVRCVMLSYGDIVTFMKGVHRYISSIWMLISLIHSCNLLFFVDFMLFFVHVLLL